MASRCHGRGSDCHPVVQEMPHHLIFLTPFALLHSTGGEEHKSGTFGRGPSFLRVVQGFKRWTEEGALASSSSENCWGAVVLRPKGLHQRDRPTSCTTPGYRPMVPHVSFPGCPKPGALRSCLCPVQVSTGPCEWPSPLPTLRGSPCILCFCLPLPTLPHPPHSGWSPESSAHPLLGAHLPLLRMPRC